VSHYHLDFKCALDDASVGTALGQVSKYPLDDNFFDWNDTSRQELERLLHGSVVAIFILSGLLACKILTIFTYETRLYSGFRHLIVLSLREQRAITGIEAELFPVLTERLLTKKFGELDLQSYVSRTPFSAAGDSYERITTAPERVKLSSASSIFARRLVSLHSTEGDGYLRESEFAKLSVSATLSKEMFHFLDTDKDGRVSVDDIQFGLRHVMKLRKEIRIAMQSKRV
jgi:hypothetical protein